MIRGFDIAERIFHCVDHLLAGTATNLYEYID